MTDLIAFLSARLDEDEARGPDIHHADCWSCSPDRFPLDNTCTCDTPARMLRQAEAGRTVLDLATTITQSEIPVPDGSHKGAADALRFVLAAWATVYSDHPDYLQEWKP